MHHLCISNEIEMRNIAHKTWSNNVGTMRVVLSRDAANQFSFSVLRCECHESLINMHDQSAGSTFWTRVAWHVPYALSSIITNTMPPKKALCGSISTVPLAANDISNIDRNGNDNYHIDCSKRYQPLVYKYIHFWFLLFTTYYTASPPFIHYNIKINNMTSWTLIFMFVLST